MGGGDYETAASTAKVICYFGKNSLQCVRVLYFRYFHLNLDTFKNGQHCSFSKKA